MKATSPARSKKPGNVFFVVIILAGLAALAGIWLGEQHPRPRPKPQPAFAPPREERRSAQPASVLSLSQTNGAVKPTSVTPLVVTKPLVTATPPIFTPPVVITKPPVVPAPSVTNNLPPAPPVPVPETNAPPVANSSQRSAQTVFEAQVALARLGISAGSIDGSIGSQTRSALRAFQRSASLPVSGELDAATKARLILDPPLYTELRVTAGDLARLQPLGAGWLSKSQQNRLDYETILELVAEKSHCHPGFVKQLNPGINWANVAAGTVVRIPNLEFTPPKATAALVKIRLAEKTLEAFDVNTNLLAHFPCSIARSVEKRPVGELRVAVIAENPDYTFNPDIFPESAEARRIGTKLILAPGPNNPVGTVWIGLDKPGYGIHGSPKPEEVGRTESHGCFRLANWNAEYLLRLVSVGTPIRVEP